MYHVILRIKFCHTMLMFILAVSVSWNGFKLRTFRKFVMQIDHWQVGPLLLSNGIRHSVQKQVLFLFTITQICPKMAVV